MLIFLGYRIGCHSRSRLSRGATKAGKSSAPAKQRQTDWQHIFSDAIIAMLKAPASEVNGCLEIDEDFLRRTGVTDFSRYSVVQGATPRRIMPAQFPDLTVAEQADEGRLMDSSKIRRSKI